MATPELKLEIDDIQGLLRHGYPYFDEAAYCLLRIDDAAGTKRWLAELLMEPEPWIDKARLRAKRLREEDCGVAIAFTRSGLERLGLDQDAMQTFVSEFQEGIAAEHRSRLLGDDGASDPVEWDWGGKKRVDALLIVFAKCKELHGRVKEIVDLGCPPILGILHGKLADKEPFGFADGISQPSIEGLTRKKGPGAERPVKAGEFVLGYANEFDRLPASPSIRSDPHRVLPLTGPGGRADFGRNGTFLVLRQLEQDVGAFNAFLDRAAAALAGTPGAPDLGRADLAHWFGAKMVGRWKSGAPLVDYPDIPPLDLDVPPPDAVDPAPKTRRELEAENDFGYHREDRHGFRCPIGAHIRRANPRDSLADASGVTPQRAQEMVNQHRILRRGRVYWEHDRKSGKVRQGLLFLCLNANLERQFEFVQNSWVMHPEFGGLHAETDPLLGNAPRDMTIQQPLLGRRIQGLGQFVKVRGGEYFFLPGLRALDYLSRP